MQSSFRGPSEGVPSLPSFSYIHVTPYLGFCIRDATFSHRHLDGVSLVSRATTACKVLPKMRYQLKFKDFAIWPVTGDVEIFRNEEITVDD